jgi:hypothetical protein
MVLPRDGRRHLSQLTRRQVLEEVISQLLRNGRRCLRHRNRKIQDQPVDLIEQR